jgi:hypothetical protein
VVAAQQRKALKKSKQNPPGDTHRRQYRSQRLIPSAHPAGLLPYSQIIKSAAGVNSCNIDDIDSFSNRIGTAAAAAVAKKSSASRRFVIFGSLSWMCLISS